MEQIEKWDDYEGRCVKARLNLALLRGTPGEDERQREYDQALKALQDYLRRTYAWPGPRIE